MSEAFILRSGNTVSKELPEFTYSGTYKLIDDGDNNWRIKFLTSGKLVFAKLNSAKKGLDVFLVGGGGGGGRFGGGGGGGYTMTQPVSGLTENTEYDVVIGAGGAAGDVYNDNGTDGGESSAFGIKAAGGYKGIGNNGGAAGGSGGSGGANRHYETPGASDGYSSRSGKGQRDKAGPNGETGTTREFGEESGDLYAGGGGAWDSGAGSKGGDGGGGTYTSSGAGNGKANTGGGGSGSGNGGRGIVIIRNRRS